MNQTHGLIMKAPTLATLLSGPTPQTANRAQGAAENSSGDEELLRRWQSLHCFGSATREVVSPANHNMRQYIRDPPAMNTPAQVMKRRW